MVFQLLIKLQNFKISTMKNEGLCQTCIYNGICMFKTDSSQPINFCEEFNSGLDILMEDPLIMTNKERIPTNTQQTGLCINCDNRNDCSIRNSNHVIWHCEEYL
jgi:hypothetical protein